MKKIKDFDKLLREARSVEKTGGVFNGCETGKSNSSTVVNYNSRRRLEEKR